MTASRDTIAEGFRAWADGDLDALEAVLDPHVRLLSVTPGPWDCTNRDQVMDLLRQRHTERHGQPPPSVHVARLDDVTYLVSRDDPIDGDAPHPFHIATRITVADGKVIEMQQYRTDTESTNHT